MHYHEALQTMWKNFDPFLHIKEEEIIDQTNSFLLIPARAPYVKDHLLIVPKRKVYILKELSHYEREEMFNFIETWTINLHTKHKDVNLLLRDWLVWGTTEKSVNHLHFHLIPDCPIWAENLNTEERKFYNNEEYIVLAQKIKNKFLS